jgi:septal ring factor EnvC (AmiA/AmiB activator)
MKKIIIAALIVLGAFLVFHEYKGHNIEGSQKIIDSLNAKIKIKEDSIVVFQNQISIFASKVAVAEEKIKDNQSKVKKIYQTYEVQIQTIDSYDVSELEQFFSDRYKDTESIK